MTAWLGHSYMCWVRSHAFLTQQWRRSLINYLNVSLFVQSSKEVAVAAPGRRRRSDKKKKIKNKKIEKIKF